MSPQATIGARSATKNGTAKQRLRIGASITFVLTAAGNCFVITKIASGTLRGESHATPKFCWTKSPIARGVLWVASSSLDFDSCGTCDLAPLRDVRPDALGKLLRCATD